MWGRKRREREKWTTFTVYIRNSTILQGNFSLLFFIYWQSLPREEREESMKLFIALFSSYWINFALLLRKGTFYVPLCLFLLSVGVFIATRKIDDDDYWMGNVREKNILSLLLSSFNHVVFASSHTDETN